MSIKIVADQFSKKYDETHVCHTSPLDYTEHRSKSTISHLGSLSDNLPNDHFDVRRRRLLYRCCYGGTQELDLILGPFAERFLANLDGVQFEQFEALLACPDPDLLDWIVNGITPPPEHDHDVMHLLRAFCAALQRRPQ